ncbi:MAG: class I SAM-dependent methyltransferase [Clostridium sp.]|nr:class I SAM-dependent methyltransferase [Clostridium sp.]MCM1398459.1 class I SAM-dependent methyltransferase [Clostridium sp.]MCM1460181.1 class I SAM-dependent methyltransferase [Bacteroides sp.]
MTNTIGKVKVNDDCYMGYDEEHGRDADEVLLTLFNRHMEEDPDSGWREREMEERKSWDILSSLSCVRQNVIEWLPLKQGMHVLEIGSDTGAITELLAKRGCHITCIEPSKKRSLANAARNSRQEHISIFVGDFRTVCPKLTGKYDFILMIGALDNALITGYSFDEHAVLIKLLASYMKQDAALVIAADNKYGLKYFSGCREYYTGKYYEGIEGFCNSKNIRTYTRKGLENRLYECGFSNTDFYYPYPDYRMPLDIFSTEYMPVKGSLDKNGFFFDGDRIKTFHESKVYDSLIEDDMYADLANSFLAVAWRKPFQCLSAIYTRYSVERSRDKQIRTSIINEDGRKCVAKHPYTESSREYVKGIYDSYNKLKERTGKAAFDINKCSQSGNDVVFEYILGHTLEVALDEAWNKDKKSFYALLDEYKNRVYAAFPTKDFAATEDFNRVFGETAFGKTLEAAAPVDVDLIFGNIMINDRWTIIDYEWTFDFLVPLNYILYRAVFDYAYKNDRRSYLWDENLYGYLGLDDNECEQYKKMDARFHKYVNGNQMSLGILNEAIGNRSFDAVAFATSKNPDVIQVYTDRGDGFSEETSMLVKTFFDADGDRHAVITNIKGCRHLRIDPAAFPCIVKIKSLAGENGDGTSIPLQYYANTVASKDGYDTYETDDPQMFIKDMNETIVRIEMVFEVNAVTADYAATQSKRLSALKFKINNRIYGGTK